MGDVYKSCPVLENDQYILRFVTMEDAPGLLKVYSDERSVPLFNSDNCHGDRFYYRTLDRMEEAIRFWILEYEKKRYVRWTIFGKEKGEVVGTIELFHRDSTDYFHDCGLLRLDLRSDYERKEVITDILSLMIPNTWDRFHCEFIATKAMKEAGNRIEALNQLGFSPTTHKLIGHDGTEYGDYFVLTKTQE
ncbi:GNAT family N-acetyltransferase [Lacrimispora sp.]|uniref:GNAT family N-acetyltransferase n=1 Tax=Lacrimispora sp. TaxID=2719234 RepID=UPI0028AC38F6|nr:GNAT family protein [Lacrimispora sp.]